MKKLSRREAALVAHAGRRAIQDYEKITQAGVKIEGRVMQQSTIAEMRAWAKLHGVKHDGVWFYFAEPWRPFTSREEAQ